MFLFGDIDEKAQTKRYLRTLGKSCNGSLFELKELIIDENFRKNRIEELEGIDPLLADDLKGLGDQNRVESKAQPILNRLDDFLGVKRLMYTFAQPPKKEMTFEKFMQEGKVIIIRVKEKVVGVNTTKALISWITLKAFMTRILMDKKGQKNGTFFVYNEVFSYMTPIIDNMLRRLAKQGRKERLGALVALQNFNDLSHDLQESILGGGVNWILYKSDLESNYRILDKINHPDFTIENAMYTEQFDAINVLNFGGKRQAPFVARMLLPSYKRYQKYNNSYLTKRHASMYGRHKDEVTDIIRQYRQIS